MNTNDPLASSTTSEEKKRRKWPIKTLIEFLPLLIALTALFSYNTIKKVNDAPLVTPLNEIIGVVPVWVVGLMGLIAFVGLSGIVWLVYLFSRAPIAPDSSTDE